MPTGIKTTLIPTTAPKTRLSWRDEWDWKRQWRIQNEKALLPFGDNPDIWHSDLVIVSDSKEPQVSDFWIFTIELGPENAPCVHGNYEEETFGSERKPLTKEEHDMLDWEAHIETPPPPKRSGTIKVRFKYIGRSKPIPIEDPWA